MLTATAGAFEDSALCGGRRFNFGDVDVTQHATWTAPSSSSAEVTFAVTLSSGREYRQASVVVSGDGGMGSSSSSSSDHAHGGHSHGHMHMGGSSSSSSSSSTSDGTAPFMQVLHVGVMHVDNMHGGADGHAGHEGHGHGGSWAGHMLPAAFFTIWGLWWAVHAGIRVAAAGARRSAYVPLAWYPLRVPGFGSKLVLLEPLLKVGLPGIGIFCELYFHPPRPKFNALHNPDGTFNASHLSFWQHSSMYSFFLLSGCVDLFAARSLPPRAPLLALAAAFLAEALLFAGHLQGGAPVTDGLHLLLVFSILGCAASIAAEAMWASPHAALARAYFTLLQGSWFAQTSHALYGKPSWPQDMTTQMALPVLFCLHLLGWAVLLLCANAMYVKNCHPKLWDDGGMHEEADDPVAALLASRLGHQTVPSGGVRHKLRVSDGAETSRVHHEGEA